MKKNGFTPLQECCSNKSVIGLSDNEKVLIQNHKHRSFVTGFTIVELLVVMGIFVSISTVMAGILSTTLRSNNKARTANEVSLNGNYALSVISNTLAGSASVVSSCVPGLSAITLRDINKNQTVITCNAGTGNIDLQRIPVTGSTTTTQLFNSSVRWSTCSFSCSQADLYSSPSVSVLLSVSQANAGALFEGRSDADFKTTVTLRNYKYR